MSWFQAAIEGQVVPSFLTVEIPMNASKENARAALKALDKIAKASPCGVPSDVFVIGEFLKAAIKKLPSEAAYINDALRKRGIPIGKRGMIKRKGS